MTAYSATESYTAADSFPRYTKGRNADPESRRLPHGEVYEEAADLVVLAAGLRPSADTESLSALLKTPLAPDGYLQESSRKTGTVESPVPGIFMAGCSAGPKDIPDSVAQASAAAALACITLSKTSEGAALL
jgi:heterodisulfide reductase subunit A-like polyferredoxin